MAYSGFGLKTSLVRYGFWVVIPLPMDRKASI